MKDVVIFGLGRMGKSFASTYSSLGGRVIAIDRSQEKVDEIADMVTYAMRADVLEESTIKELGISDVDMAVIAMGDSFEASIMAITACRELGISQITAKAHDKLQGTVLQKVGATQIIYPEIDTGRRLAHSIAHGERFSDVADISGEFSIIETGVPKSWIGKSLVQIDPRSKCGVNVIAIKEGDTFNIHLDVNEPFKEDMTLVVLGDLKELEKVFK